MNWTSSPIHAIDFYSMYSTSSPLNRLLQSIELTVNGQEADWVDQKPIVWIRSRLGGLNQKSSSFDQT